MIIKKQFFKSVGEFSNDKGIAEKLWRELEEKYSAKTRHYHTLVHLDDVLKQLVPLKNAFTNWQAIVFAVAYHDAIYNALRGNNEEKSALLAVERLKSIGVPEEYVSRCQQLILATKKHEAADYETNLFTDADLSILGSDTVTYNLYLKNIRQEYAMYPDILYNAGRKKVLFHFLNMDQIFKTKEFSGRFEAQARKNLQDELRML
ncbi:MAG TPA: hypothetical protein VIQ51_00020 [Chryseosolibacter sp.]